MGTIRAFRYPVSPLEALVLIHHVVHCEDAENDADRTVQELVQEIDHYDGYISKGVLESALYCCNLENERGHFWHPLKYPFDSFLRKVIPGGQHFDKYYNCLYEIKEEANGSNAKARR